MKYLFKTIFLLLITVTLFAGKLPQGVQVYESGNGYHIQFNLGDYRFESVRAGDGEYYVISGKDFGVVPNPGYPALPAISFNVILNFNEDNILINNIATEIEQKKIDKRIYPYQAPWEKSKDLSDRPFTINEKYYLSNGEENPQFVTLSEPFVIAGQKGITVTLHPFFYNPKENSLLVNYSGAFDLDLNLTPAVKYSYSKIMSDYLNDVFVNFKADTYFKNSMNYLIITPDSYSAQIQTFADYKTSKGYNVTVAPTSATGATTTSIKSYIQSLYDNEATRPEFILLVGDVGDIPPFTGSGEGSPITDNNYAMLDGSDHWADAFIGRFSVSNSTELDNAINKSIYMDSHIGTLNKDNVFMASTDNSNISEGTHNYVIENYFDPDGYNNLKLYTDTYNATTAQLIDALNSNKQFAIYSGHGSPTSWADGPPLGQTEVRALTNTYYPYVYSFACETGEFDYGECFGETWLRDDHAAASFYGSSVTSYWTEDDVLERQLFKAMFEDNLTQVTPMFNMGKYYMVQQLGGGLTGGSTNLRYIEMYNLMGDPSLAVKQQIAPDSTPPEPITDLAPMSETSNSITVQWTAPLDTTFGGVMTYDVRCSLTPIVTDDDFNACEQYLYGGNSDSAGVPKSYTVDNLNYNSTYYVCIKAMDIWGNTSEMSNVITVATYDAPALGLSASSVSEIMDNFQTVVDSIIISNTTPFNSTLEFQLSIMNNTFPGAKPQINIVPIAESSVGVPNLKETKDSEKSGNGVSVKGSGGPDDFGYKWIDSNDPNGPAYEWNDISSTGAQVTSWNATGSFFAEDEGYGGPFDLGFDFKFYGTVYNQVYCSTNGPLTFAPITSDIFSNEGIPNTDYPNNIIAGFWDDLNKGNGNVYYQNVDGKFIIQYNNWERYSGSGTYTYQYVLYPSGKIMIYYKSMTGSTTGATVGIENEDGTDGLQMSFNSDYIEDEMALKISADPDWLSVSYPEAMLYNGNSATVYLTFSSEDYPGGDYSMDLVVSSNDPTNQEVVIPVSMTINGGTPVELTGFSANQSDDAVVLNWSTATETNNKGFSIERKLKSEKSFEELTFVDGNGTTTEKTNYSYADYPSRAGVYVYRLRQIDLDGTYEIAGSVEVNYGLPTEFSLKQNYPNPFNPATTIKFSLPKAENVNLAVFNILGEEVSTLINEKMEAGYHQVNFNATPLPSGIYIYKIQAGNFNSVKKMMLLK